MDAKIELWKNKLLDLGKRNKLISYKETKRSTLTISKPDMYSLWESFVKKEEELIFPFYNDAFDDENDEDTTENSKYDYDVVTNQSIKELQKTLRNLRNKGNTSLEEQGINTLYLAFGFLKWKESEGSKDYITSPLVLVPVRLKVESISSPFVMELHDDEIQSNASLAYKLENDFGITIPEYDEEESLEAYLEEVRDAIKGNRWIVDDSVGLGLFSFSKMNMYNDLEQNRDKISANPVIRAICGDASAVENIPEELIDFDFDNEIKVEDVCQIVDADSSQQDAILCAKKGISFVLQGPPGTGKSQTITNIIAEAIADGKKVLFVSEKMAALDVVYRRLNNANLGDFCLVLHNHKANKKAVLEQLENSMELAGRAEKVSAKAYNKLYELQNDRDKLNNYAEEVFREIEPLGKSVYWVNGQIANLEDYPDIIFNVERDIRKISNEDYNRILYALNRYITSINSMSGNFKDNPWKGTNLTMVTNEFRHDVGFKLPELRVLLNEQEERIREVFDKSLLRLDVNYDNISNAIKIFNIAKNSPLVPVEWIVGEEIEPLLEEIEKWEERKNELEVAKSEIEKHYNIVLENNVDNDIQMDIKAINSMDIIRKYENNINNKIDNDSVFSNIKNSEYMDLCINEFKTAKDKADKINELKEQIEDKFTKKIYTLEYKPVLLRYMTEYKSFLKYFKGMYKEDRNNMMSYYASVTEKMTDDIVKDALLKLNQIDDIKIEIAQECPNFIETIGSMFAYENTDFVRVNKLFNTYSGLKNCINNLNKVGEIVQNWTTDEEILQKHYDFLYKGTDTEWGNIRNAVKWTIDFRKIVEKYNINPEFVRSICLDTEAIETCNEYVDELSDCHWKLSDKLSWYLNLFNEEENLKELNMGLLAERISACQNGLALLEEWIDFENARKNCAEEGLTDYISNVEESELRTGEIIPVFKKRFFRLWLDAVLEELPSVSNFRTANHMSVIDDFANLDRMQFEISKARIRSRLISNLPMLNRFTSGTDEVGILKRELSKKRKIMPLRKLFMKIPHLIPMLKPCFMMSPLSVSLFLNTDLYNFDTVIFDEASQVCTENAIGAILRGKQVIITGDSKQLPPTNFFSSSTSENDFDIETDDDFEDDSDAYESILDEANLLPERTLLWHYRSRHEHLIAFSNAKIYKNQLITFPSSTDKMKDNGVEYIYVENGCYDRGGRNGNAIEAKRVAELVFEHFKKHPNRSLGVIAFGEVQQLAIESALRKMRMENQSFERFFNEELEEPFFIKNLENVQGDERDTIIFSIGYAKDAAGVFHMNFGPLSKVGGERRLNVAVTRAKYNVKLVGSIMPTDINIDRISAEGPKLLRNYIDFAMNGIGVLQRDVTESDIVEYDSPFEQAVYNFLDRKGYKVATQVGCSGYRIDLAVKHPTLSGKYILGIECDGAAYHSARTARERDRLRQDVLENMGWKIHRVWSTDWIKDPACEGQKIVDAIECALKNFGEDENYSNDNSDDIPDASEFISVEKRVVSANPYDFADEIKLKSDRNLRNCYTNKNRVKRIIELMYPIHYDELCREIAPYMGREKATKVVKDEVDYCIMQLYDEVYSCNQFYFPKAHGEIVVRLNNSRRIEHVSPLELAEAMYKVLQKSIGIEKDALCTETARAYNYNRMTSKISAAMEEAFAILLRTQRIVVSNGKVEINS